MNEGRNARANVQPLGPESLALAAALLRAGDVVAFPTETVYGLGGSALAAAAVERIYAVKGRPRHNPLIVHVADEGAAAALAATWPPAAAALAARFWPGPLTLVLPRGPQLPPIVSAGLDTVALRVPAGAAARALLAACGLPLAAPSANRSEQLSPTTAAHVAAGLPDVPLILDGGPCPLGIESTVVDLTSAPPRLLRPGALPLAQLREVLPDLAVAEPGAVAATPAAPGQLARHYAPRARLLLSASEDLDPAAVLALPAPRGLLGHRLPPAAALAPLFAAVESLPDDAAGYAADLYAALHRLDDAGVAGILALAPPPGDAWLAVRDRLQRASREK